MFRVGILYRIVDLLKFLRENTVTRAQFDDSFRSWRGVSRDTALKTAIACAWIEQLPDGSLTLSEGGCKLLLENDPATILRSQLECLIRIKKPSWLRLALRGRSAISRYAPPDVVQCFDEAGLFSDNSTTGLRWWDSLLSELRGVGQLEKTQTGRDGERRSIDYENRRTGRKPSWIAVDNADAGYDILSTVNEDDCTPLAIEVKSSMRSWQFAKAHLSRNEWDVLSSCPFAMIHLWGLGEDEILFASVHLDVVENHVAQDAGSGEWQEVLIPFMALCSNPTSPRQ